MNILYINSKSYSSSTSFLDNSVAKSCARLPVQWTIMLCKIILISPPCFSKLFFAIIPLIRHCINRLLIQAFTDFESSLFNLIIFCLKELNIKALI